MATLIQIRDKANVILGDFWSVLQTKQNAYFAKHGKYFQLLVSPTVKVVDGVDQIFSKRIPNDELHQEDVDFSFGTQIPFQIQVNEWVGSDSRGYTATVRIELLDGRIFERSRNSLNIDSGWNEVIKEN